MNDEFPMWTVYRHPRDFPGKFVVRRSVLYCGHDPRAGQVANDIMPLAVVESLEDARALIPKGLHRLPRYAEDDPVIVEVWI